MNWTEKQLRLRARARKRVATKLRKCAEDFGGVNKLADAAGVSRSQMFDILGEKKSASVDWIDKVAEVAKVEAYTFLS